MNYNSIILHTAKSNEIENFQNAELSKFDLSILSIYDIRYPLKIKRDEKPNPQYNCHGLTFANRRTGIPDPDQVRKILNDDNYIEIMSSDLIPGDIVLYFSDGNENDIEHSGIVIEINNLGFATSQKILSKWGWGGYEVIHDLYQCPYNKTRIKYYRLVKT